MSEPPKAGSRRVRLSPEDPAEPGGWLPDLGVRRVAGTGRRESEIAVIGPAIEAPESMRMPAKEANE